MRQRNAGAHPLTVMTDPPREVAAGEVIDFDEPLAGFEPVDDSDDAPEQPSDEAKSPKNRKSKAAASADSDEEVTR